MPFKSQAQARFFHAAEVRGQIAKKTVDEFDKATDFKTLPKRVGSKKGSKRPRLKDYIGP